MKVILYLIMLIASKFGCQDQKQLRNFLLGFGLVCFIGATPMVMAFPPAALVMFPLGVIILRCQTILVERIQKIDPTYF